MVKWLPAIFWLRGTNSEPGIRISLIEDQSCRRFVVLQYEKDSLANALAGDHCFSGQWLFLLIGDFTIANTHFNREVY